MSRVSLALIFLLLAAPLAAQINLPHSSGGTLTLSRPATRIVTLAPNLAELVFAAGGGQYLLATVAYSDFPAEVQQIPRLGDAFRVDLEALLALQPDLVLVWESGNPTALIGRLEQLDLPVWRTELQRPEEISRLIRAMGHAMNTAGTATAVADAFDERLAALRERYSGVAPVDYFYQVSERPLYTINGKHLISQALDLCGGRNIFAGLQALAPSIGMESVITSDPDVMFAPEGNGMQGGLDQWRRWESLQAVQQDHLYYLDADRISRASPRFLETIEQACHYLSGVRQQRLNNTRIHNQ